MKILLISALSALSVLSAAEPTPAPAATPTSGHTGALDIVDTAASVGDFGTLLAAAKAAGLVDALKADGPLTVFAPTDAAFAALPEGTLERLLEPENKDDLVAILTYHVVPGAVSALGALQAGEAATLQGGSVGFRLADGRLQVNDSNVVANDVSAANGVIHVIDQVLLPPAPLGDKGGRKVIGVYTDSVSRKDRQALGLDGHSGIRIDSLVRGGNSQAAGLLAGDIIVTIDGRVATSEVLAEAKEQAGVGGRLELLIARRIQVEVGVED